MIQQNRLPHALLLSGHAGTGKFHFAKTLAGYLLCELANPAHQNKNRTLFSSENGHPDMSVVVPEGKIGMIKIGQIRELTNTLSKTAQQGGYRVIIINHADEMSAASSNALLKTLEEPGDKVCIMLLSSSVYRLLPTIRSRCQQYNISVEDSIGKAWLQKELPTADIELLWRLSGHAPLKGQEIATGKWLAQRKTLLEGVLQAKDPITTADKLYQDADKHRVLNCLNTLVTDIMKRQVLAATDIINIDYKDSIKVLASSLSQRPLLRLYHYYCQAKLDLDKQVSLNQQLLFEDWLIQWCNEIGIENKEMSYGHS